MKEENPSKEVQSNQEDISLQPMKEKEGIELVYRKDEGNEITDARDADEKGERVTPMLEENQLRDSIKEEKDRNGEDVIADNQVVEAEKVGESQIGLAKKPKQGPRQSLKPKPTIPQPFSLSTEKRMSKEKRGSIDFSSENMKRKPKERHGSMDFKNSYSQPRLSRSVSLSRKDRTSPNAKETSDLNRAKSIRGASKTSPRPQVTGGENIENRIGKTTVKTLFKGAESKQLKGNDKKQQADEMKSSNLQRNSVFKALPLPRFYQRKDSPSKTETKKKMSEISSKSTLFGQQNCTKSISKAENNNKQIEDKGKGSSKTRTNGAKETISKLLRSTRKVL